MKVLVVGAGAREHALVRKLARSPLATALHCAPGNAGIAAHARCHDLDADALVAFAVDEAIDLVVVGPEAPLVAGLVDGLREGGVRAFGPSAAAARLEGSKRFAKQIMDEAGVATARWRAFDGGDVAAAEAWAAELGGACVVKADGLAAGKGVTVCGDLEDARLAIRDCLRGGRFGPAGATVVVEERLEGQEVSLMALCDARAVRALAPARDYKRLMAGDRGPNTGGMGAFSPVPGVDEATVEEWLTTIHRPVVQAMAARGTPFVGVLYAGLMRTPDGPRVLEFNVRFGDPETQAVLPRLRSDLLGVLLACTEGGLGRLELDWRPDAAVTVVLAADGYPLSPRTGDAIFGLEEAEALAEIDHAGTRLGDGSILTSGGRILCATALGPSHAEARERAYAAASQIEFAGRQMRPDVAAEVG